MKSKISTLILEDHLEFSSEIIKILSEITQEIFNMKYEDIFVIELYSNFPRDKFDSSKFDLIILDRDTADGFNFHNAIQEEDFKRAIAISSEPEYNKIAILKGSKYSLEKYCKGGWEEWRKNFKNLVINYLKERKYV